MDTVHISEVLRSISRACDLAASRPYGFSQRVARVAVRLADTAGLSEDLKGDLLIAALLHSAGFAAISGDVARIAFGDERPLMRLYPLDAIFERLEVGAQLDADGESRTGVFMRHHIALARFPLVTCQWLQRAGMPSAGLIAATMLEFSERARHRGPISMASALLSLAYHMVSVRWLAVSTSAPDRSMAERARDLVGDDAWLGEMAGVIFEAPLLPMAEEVWGDDQFWQEMDEARTGAWIRIVRPLPESDSAETGDEPTSAEGVEEVDTDTLLGSYSFSANELNEDVPDVDAAIRQLLEPRFGGDLPLHSPVLEAFLQILGRMVDAKTVFPSGHANRVANMVREVAILLEVDDAQVARLRTASWFYGVGKLALPSALLEQGGGLRSDQRAMILETPKITRTTLAPLRAIEETVAEAACYAERLDGSGYPKGLKSEDIPLSGRLLAVVDIFEAMQADRPYRPAYSRARALHILQAQSGKLFDGLITDLVEGITRGEL